MKLFRSLAAAAVLVITSTTVTVPQVAAQTPIQTNPVDPSLIPKLVGAWKNQMGSTLTITSLDAASGKIEGKYETATGALGAFPLMGWVNTLPPENGKHNAVAIAWTVRWGQIGTITSWTGIYGDVDGATIILGQWNLAKPVSNYQWDHILAGQDRFTKLP